MDFTGKWIADKILSFTDDGMKLVSISEIDPTDSDMAQMACTFLEITESAIEMKMQIPAEMLEEAKAAGEVVPDDGVITMQSMALKTVDGEVYYNDGTTGEIMDTVLDGWTKLTLDEEGLLNLGPAAYKKA